jgi:hypothetical protein
MKLYLPVSVMAFTALFNSGSLANTYAVRPGDTLSTIAQKELDAPSTVYGPQGRIAALVKLNPQIHDPNRIFPGDVIQLSEDLPRAPAAENKPIITPTVTPTVTPAVAAPTPPALAPPPLAPPPAVVAEAKPAELPHDLHLGVHVSQVYSSMNAIDYATDAHATLVSDLMTEVGVNVQQVFDERHEVGLAVSWLRNSYAAPKTGETLASAPTTKSIEGSYRYALAPQWHLDFAAGIEQSLFVRAESIGHYVFDVPQIPFARFGAEYLFLRQARREAGVRAFATGLGHASTSGQEISTGHAFSAEAFLRQTRGDFYLHEGLFFSQTLQNSNLVEEKLTSFGLGIGLEYGF